MVSFNLPHQVKNQPSERENGRKVEVKSSLYYERGLFQVSSKGFLMGKEGVSVEGNLPELLGKEETVHTWGECKNPSKK